MKNACVRTLTNTYMMKIYLFFRQVADRKTKDRKRPVSSPFRPIYLRWVHFMAEPVGFEPTCLLGKRFSRPPRYDRFDTAPCLVAC